MILTSAMVFSMLFSSCSRGAKTNEQYDNSNNKVSVVTSFYVMYDFATKIGGDKVSVINLLPPGSDPHGWEPSPKDIIKIENSDIFIYNGAGMEGWVHKVLDSIKNKELIVLEASSEVDLLKGGHRHENENKHEEFNHDHEHNNNNEDNHEVDDLYDPHVWLDPMSAKVQMKAIADTLVDFDSDNADYYMDNFEKYSKELDKLDQEYRKALSGFVKRDIVVSHEAFGYLCSSYGLNQIGISGLDAEAEPTASRMVQVADFVKENDIKIIFFDNMVSPRVASAIADATGAEVGVLNPIASLSKEEIEEGKDYFAIMRENLNALIKALADGENG
ncbi:MAG: zinc ABC transporter substrate-binding protein [Clostridiaceae bacterium]|nr:zinc ABC transporter substrate-binding protein [Clostridiaceae bacterium]